MKAVNLSKLSEPEFRRLVGEVSEHYTLRDVLSWASTKSKADIYPQIVAEVVTQDEFTHDVIVPYRSVFLVYDTT